MLKANFQERRDIREWVDAEQALNTAYHERQASTPYHHVRAGAVDKILNLDFVDRSRLESGHTR